MRTAKHRHPNIVALAGDVPKDEYPYAFLVPYILVTAIVLIYVAFQVLRNVFSPPTALCGDGSYSWSEHHGGTCSWHHGVQAWWPKIPWWRIW